MGSKAVTPWCEFLDICTIWCAGRQTYFEVAFGFERGFDGAIAGSTVKPAGSLQGQGVAPPSTRRAVENRGSSENADRIRRTVILPEGSIRRAAPGSAID
jgi:hypothetical protein